MTHPSKVKGDRAERAFLAYAAPYWPNARRGKAGAEADLGDIFGIVDRDSDPWTVQVADRKWRSHSEVEAKAAEAAQQAERAGVLLWCLVAKRPRAEVGDWFVWLPTWALYGCIDWPGPHGQEREQWADLACITVRAWVALIAPEQVEVAT